MGLGSFNLDLNPVKDPNLRFNLEKLRSWAMSVEQRLSLTVTQTGGDSPSEPTGPTGSPIMGTINRLVKYTSATTIGNASALEDGTKVFSIQRPLGLPSNQPLYWATDETTALGSLAASLKWSTTTTPNQLEIDVGPATSNADTRHYIRKFITGTDASLDFSPFQYVLGDSTSYTTTPSTSIYRGLDIGGSVSIGASGGSGGPELLSNGNFSNWTTDINGTYPNFWWTQFLTAQVTGRNGTGYAIQMTTSIAAPSTIESRTPGGYDPDPLGRLYFQLTKNTTYLWSFYVRMSSVQIKRNLFLRIAAFANDTDSNPTYHITHLPINFPGGTTLNYDLTGASWPVVDGTFTLEDFPSDNVWRQVNITFDTNNVGASVGTNFYAEVRFYGHVSADSSTWEFDDVSLRLPGATTINAPLTTRLLALDQANFTPALSSSGDSLTLTDFTGIHARPAIVPVIASGANITIPTLHAIRAGLDFTLPAGNLTADNAYSLYAEEPEVGTAKWAGWFAGNVAIGNAKQLRWYESGDGNYTAIQAGTQSADITYTLPTAAPAVSGYLLSATTAGVMSWIAPTTGSLTGTGTSPRIPKWLTSTSLTDSNLSDLGGGVTSAVDFNILNGHGLYIYNTGTVHYNGFLTAAGQGVDLVYTLPTTAPAVNGYVLSATTGGVMSWIAAGAGTVAGSGTLNTIPRWTPDGVTLGNSSETDDGTTFTIGKRTAWTPAAAFTAAATQNNYDVGDVSVVRFNTGVVTDLTLTGLANGTDGRILRIYKTAGTYGLVLKNESASSTTTNRFHLLNGEDMRLVNDDYVDLQYDSTLGRWRYVNSNVYVTPDPTDPGIAAGQYVYWTGTGHDVKASELLNDLADPGPRTISCGAHFIPDATPSGPPDFLGYDLGKSTQRWRTLYVGNIATFSAQDTALTMSTDNSSAVSTQRFSIDTGADQATATFSATDLDMGGGSISNATGIVIGSGTITHLPYWNGTGNLTDTYLIYTTSGGTHFDISPSSGPGLGSGGTLGGGTYPFTTLTVGTIVSSYIDNASGGIDNAGPMTGIDSLTTTGSLFTADVNGAMTWADASLAPLTFTTGTAVVNAVDTGIDIIDFQSGGSTVAFISRAGTYNGDVIGDLTGTASTATTAAALSPAIAPTCDIIALTNQSASIGSTNFANASTAGLYRVDLYLVCTTADLTAGSIAAAVTYNDGTAARTLTSTTVLLTATTNKTTKWTNSDIDGTLIRLGSGNVAYSTTLTGSAGSAKYALYLSLERLN